MSISHAVRTARLAAALLLVPVVVQGQRVVTPDGPWVSELRGSGGSAAITGNNPRNGNGSLELSVSGDLFDWGWFNLFAGDPLSTPGWGQLAALTRLSFDWFRESAPVTNDVVWEAQTPVLRLYVRSGPLESPIFSELVWERWYNLASPAPVDQWVTENATDQLFWRFVAGSGYTISDCSSPAGIDPAVPLLTASVASWANGNGCYMQGDAVVYGIGVGVGSNWPNSYRAYVDNVMLGFNDDPTLAVHDNFELQATATPEPATMLLLGTGLAGIGGAAARRRQRRKNASA